MDILWRRLTLWILTLFSGWLALILDVMANQLQRHLDLALDGKPLPAITQLMLSHDLFYYGQPIIMGAVALAFTIWKKPSPDATLFAAITGTGIMLLVVATFAFAAALPFGIKFLVLKAE